MKRNFPTVFHISNWKAGSQWIRKIIEACVPGLTVTPRPYQEQFLKDPIQTGKVYTTLYITREQFYGVKLPPLWKRFIVFRDLRDTLISGYFSFRFSHPVIAGEIGMWRSALETLNLEDGLIYVFNEWLPFNAAIQSSWLDEEDKILKYEDLVRNDVEILEDVLLDKCQFQVSRDVFREIVMSNRFEKLTGGRQRGVEDINAHERKGVSGDWKTLFTDKVKDVFKNKYGHLLVETGYEKDLDW